MSVLGAIVALCMLLILLGYFAQRKARRGGHERLDEKTGPPVGIRWEGLGYALPAHRKGLLGPKKEGRVILDDLSGHVDGGLCAILGPTGAGKSTFVDLLAGKRKSGDRAGSVHLLTHGQAGERVKIGFVDQHDVLPATSTVREALMFAAELKMPESVSKEDKK